MRLFVSCLGLLSASLMSVVLANPRTEKPGWQWSAQTKQARVYQEEGVDEDDYDVFYQNLSSDGRWLETDDYGYVFQPNDADSADWGPYRSGHWVWTDYGWYWQSDEDYGWACYHYGRWVRIFGIGWVWVPGSEWAPAWVSWRQSDDYCGWAPLPPECSVSVGFSIGGWCDTYYGLGPAAYCFIHFGDWFRPNYYHYFAPGVQNVAIIQRTVNVTNFYRNNNNIVNDGPQAALVSQRAGGPINRYNINYIAQNNGHYRTAVQGNQLNVVAPPQVLKASASVHPNVARTLGNAQVDKGWQGVPPGQATALKQQFATQHAVPANLPNNPQYTQKAVFTPANKTSSANTQPPNLIKPFNQNTQTTERTVGTTNGQTLSNVPPGTVTKRFSQTQNNEPLNKNTQVPGTVETNRRQNGPNGPTKAFTTTVQKHPTATNNFVDQTRVPVAQPTPPPNSNHASTVQHSNLTVRKPEVQRFSDNSTSNYVQSTKTNHQSASVYHAPANTTQVYHPPVNTYHAPVNTYHPPATTYHPPANNSHPPVYHPAANAYHAPVNAGRPPTSQPHPNNGGNRGGRSEGKDKKK